MSHNPYIYILIMAAVTFAIRVLPLTLVKKQFTNTFVHFPEAIRCLSGAPSFSGGTPFFHKKHHGGDQCQPRGEQQKILIHCISPYIFVFFRWEA